MPGSVLDGTYMLVNRIYKDLYSRVEEILERNLRREDGARFGRGSSGEPRSLLSKMEP